MPIALPRTPAERFAGIIDGLCRAVAARGAGRERLAGPLVILIWSRLRHLAAGFAALAGRIAAGRHRRVLNRRPTRPAPSRGASRQPPERALPHTRAWLLPLVPQACAYRSQLRHLMADPEFAALVDAAPQMRRLLRPLCRMLGITLPPAPRPAAPPPQGELAAAMPAPNALAAAPARPPIPPSGQAPPDPTAALRPSPQRT